MATLYRAMILFLVMIISIEVSATTITWTGTLDDDWNNTLNWSPTQIPTHKDSVSITGNVKVKIYNGDEMSCYHLSLSNKDLLEIEAGASLNISNGKDADAIVSPGDIVNNGTIIIKDCFTGITSSHNIENNGKIIISNISSIGLKILAAGTFDNYGEIEIDGSTYGMSNRGTFNNYGVYFSTDASTYDINQRGTLLNDHCAKMTTAGFSNTSSSTTDNDGTITWNERTADLDNSATFNSSGVIADHFFTDPSILGYINSSGVIIQSPSATLSIGDVITDLIDSSPFNSIGDSVYTDADLTMSAGPIKGLSREWTVNSGAYGKDTFYLDVQISLTCRDTIPFYTKEPILDCSDTNSFTGALSSLWSIAANWDQGHVPKECETANISGHNVEIPAGYAAECRSLLVIGDNDTLEIGVGGSLDISRGSLGIVGDDNGVILNNGTITVSQVSSIALFATDFHLINTGTIDISNIENTGIYIDSGLVDNSGTITISEIVGNGLNLQDGSLSNSGTIDINSTTSLGLDASGANFDNSGSISISDVESYGLRLLERHLSNDGKINIENTGDIGLIVSDTLDNNGSIDISNTTSTCMWLDGYLNNYGSVDIENPNATGLLLSSDEASFKNKQSIRRTKSGRTTQFLNYGTLTLRGDSTDLLNNNGILYNDSCGIVSIYGQLTNQQIINNYGIWDQEYNGLNDTTGTFNNYGIINDMNGSFQTCIDASSCYNTTGLRFGATIEDSSFVRRAYDDILSEISATMIVDSIWYLGPDFSDEAGTYDRVTNSFTPSADALEYQNFYFPVSIGTSGCLDTIMINFDYLITAAACDSLNALSSKIGFTDWTSSRFWDLKREPSSCDDIYVEDSAINIEVSTGDTAVCNTLTWIEGQLTIDSSAVMIIQE